MNLVLDTMCGGPERVSLADERTVREVRGLLRAPREVGDALESRLSSRLERLLDADLTAVRVHRGDVAHRLTARVENRFQVGRTSRSATGGLEE